MEVIEELDPNARFLKTRDGVRIFEQDWPIHEQDQLGSIMLVHGLGENIGRYNEVAQMFNDMGLYVRGYDHRGFGRSNGIRGDAPEPITPVEDLKDMYDLFAQEMAQRPGVKPPFILGHSMGGAILGRALSGGYIRPSAAVLTSPAVGQTPKGTRKLLYSMSKFFPPHMSFGAGVNPEKVSHDIDRANELILDDLNHSKITPTLAKTIFEEGNKAVEDAGSIDFPILVLSAGDDHIVDKEGAGDFVVNIDKQYVQHVDYPGLYHELLNEIEQERAKVFADIRTWLEQRLSAELL